MKIRESTPRMIALVGALYLGGMTAVLASTSADITTGPGSSPDIFSSEAAQDQYVSLAEYIAMHEASEAFIEVADDAENPMNEMDRTEVRSIDRRLRASKYFGDAWVSTKVKALLLRENLLRTGRIDVDAQGGDVQLSGWAKDEDQLSAAIGLACSVDGVQRVINHVVIKN